jgi:hypothetical protein
VVGGSCPVCTATTIEHKRVRRNLRKYSETKYAKLSTAINALKAKRGGKNYDYFVAKQMAAYYDSRGNQADFGSHFITWHTLFLLEFEVELLKIDSSLGAIPYWDWGDGEYPTFPIQYFGLLSGSGEKYQINRGPYYNFPIASTSNESWSSSIEPHYTSTHAVLPEDAPASRINFYGATTSGKLRNTKNVNTNDLLTRPGPYTFTPRGFCIPYNQTDVLARRSGSDCAETARFPHMNWYSCMEGEQGFTGPPWNNVSIIRTPMYYVGVLLFVCYVTHGSKTFLTVGLLHRLYYRPVATLTARGTTPLIQNWSTYVSAGT